jgi:hypothetical protein
MNETTSRDDCNNCSSRGNFRKCRFTPCIHHYSWIVKELENIIQSKNDLLKRCLTTLRNIRNTISVVSPPIYMDILDQLISDLEAIND